MKVLASRSPRSSVGMSLLLRATGLFAGLLFSVGSTACGEWSKGGSVVEIESRFTAIGSAFPTTLLIPDRQGFQSRAFVQTASLPLGVFSFDLDAITSPLPFEFFDLSKVLQGIPQDLVIENRRDLAFVATSGESEGIWVFNPVDAFRFLTSFTYGGCRLVLPNPAPDSDGNLVRFVKPTLTAGVALLQGKVYIPTSNLIQPGSNPVNAPGTVMIVGFDDIVEPQDCTLLPPPNVITTSDYNPTEVTPFGDRILLVTNTGVLAIRKGMGVPLTDGSVDVVDTNLDCIVAKYPLGLGAPGFSKIAIAEQQDQRGSTVHRGYLGSAAFNHVYELDLTGLDQYLGSCPDPEDVPMFFSKVLAGANNPIRATLDPTNTPNLVTQVVVNQDGTRAYATGFNSGTLAILELETATDEAGTPLPSKRRPLDIIQVTPPLPTQNEAAPGPVAVRPGIPCDPEQPVEGCFRGPDVFVVTGTPIGELRGFRAY